MDIKHTLVATDLTDRSERALSQAVDLAQGCSITLLHVLPAGLPDALRMRLQTEIESFLDESATRIRARPGSGDIRTLVLSGDPYRTIIVEGIMRRADLLVVGEPAKLRRQDLFLGTTAERVARFTDRPVLVVKQGGLGGYSRVLVAFDGSEAAVRALDAALALSPDAEFRITHAWWPKGAALGLDDEKRQGSVKQIENVRAQVEHAVKKAATTSRPNKKLTVHLIENNPYVAMRHDSEWADLLVMGTHSKARLAMSTEIGKLALHMLSETPCDMLLSPP